MMIKSICLLLLLICSSPANILAQDKPAFIAEIEGNRAEMEG
jgi:hypothetical protein